MHYILQKFLKINKSLLKRVWFSEDKTTGKYLLRQVYRGDRYVLTQNPCLDATKKGWNWSVCFFFDAKKLNMLQISSLLIFFLIKISHNNFGLSWLTANSNLKWMKLKFCFWEVPNATHKASDSFSKHYGLKLSIPKILNFLLESPSQIAPKFNS